jgi:hypothetical protein
MVSASAAHGAPFNQQLRAPQADAQQLQEKLQRHFDIVDARRGQGEMLIRDPAAFQQWTDLQWTIERRLDEGRALGDEESLARVGVIKQRDGSYIVHTKDFPQWKSLVAALVLLANPSGVESFAPALEARGFRAEDLEKIRDYIRTHDLDAAGFAEHKELVQTFAKRAATARKEDVLAFMYQGARLQSEHERQWAVGLLDTLDAQRRRALTSYLMDELDSTISFGPPAPSQRLDENIAKTLAPLVSGEYQRQLDQAEAELGRDAR